VEKWSVCRRPHISSLECFRRVCTKAVERGVERDVVLRARVVKAACLCDRWCAFGESTMKPINYQVCCGSSNPGSWNQFGGDAVYTDVNAQGCKFDNDPYYFSSITDKACGGELFGSGRCTATGVGAEAHYSASKSGFRVYTKPISGQPAFNYATSRANGWQLDWCGVSTMAPTQEGSAGYPCTSHMPTTNLGSGSVVLMLT
jgi:hypothetical protein